MKEDRFIKFLKEHKKESYFLVAAPGNSGDALLKKGLELFLKKNGFKILKKIENSNNILIHGGGNIDDVHCSGIELFKNMSETYPNKKIIVAPSTCHFLKTDFEKILNGCEQKIYFFVREKNSYERLNKMKLNKNILVYLANDTAFLLENTHYLNKIKKQSKTSHVLFSFRTDKESKLLKIEAHMGDYSFKEKIKDKYIVWSVKRFIKKNIQEKYNNGKNIIIDASYQDYGVFVNLISNASEIYTDRLHVGILGAMLGKRIHLYRTKYDKVQGVYEQTLHEYSNVVKMF